MSRIYKMHNLFTGIDKVPKVLDYMITCANSNMRCFEASYKLSDKIEIRNNLVFDYDKLRPNDGECNQECTEYYFGYKKFKSLTLCLCKSDDEPMVYLASKIEKDVGDVGIDITGFTIPDVFRVIYILKRMSRAKRLHVFYSEPQTYLFKEDVFNTYEYLVGERTYKPIPEFYTTGRFKKELLVFFLGFDMYVTNYVHENAQPAESVIINGFPAYMPKMKDISLLNNSSILNDIVDRNRRFFVAANNPFKAYNVLCDIKDMFADCLMNICVLGTRPMALGSAMFALDNLDSVKVTYPYPQKYSHNTSTSCTNSWYYFFDFEDNKI